MARILTVDDDPDIVLAVRMCLEDAGHEVFEASNGEEGLRQVAEVKPDLIILDVMMDTPTTGFQMALRLRNPDPTSPLADYKDVPILVLSSIHSTTDLRFGPDENYLPIEEFIDKPIDLDLLVSKVNTLLNKKQ